ncbi:MAG: N-acetyltransferase [Bacteroidota bacterium]
MKIHIRPEKPADQPIIFELIEAAFAEEEYSDHQEQFLVDRLRASDAFIPALSLVAERENQILGYILLTKIHIQASVQSLSALALAPVAVLPPFQGQGIGGMLIREAHRIAKALGHERIILLGHADYYPRFGYQRCVDFGIRMPFEVPDENCMVLGLTENALKGVAGEVVYSKAFG